MVEFWCCATLGAAILKLLCKLAFARARPDLWHSIISETSYSFPNGHAMASMAVAATLIVVTWRTR
jgi:membrane-associated phospholipid phosphatase